MERIDTSKRSSVRDGGGDFDFIVDPPEGWAESWLVLASTGPVSAFARAVFPEDGRCAASWLARTGGRIDTEPSPDHRWLMTVPGRGVFVVRGVRRVEATGSTPAHYVLTHGEA